MLFISILSTDYSISTSSITGDRYRYITVMNKTSLKTNPHNFVVPVIKRRIRQTFIEVNFLFLSTLVNTEAAVWPVAL